MTKLFSVAIFLVMVFATNGVMFAEFGEIVFAGAETGENRLAQFFPDSGSPFKRMRYKKSSLDRSESKSGPRDLFYKKLVLDLQNLRAIGDLEAFRRIPHVEVLVNWHLGEKIVAHLADHEPADGESRLTEQLAVDMAVEKDSLVSMVRFYRSYRDVSEVSTALSWDHYVELIAISDNLRRKDFQEKAITNRWSSDQLREALRISP